MRLFQWLADLFAGSSDPPRASSDEGVSINPATGLPMTGPGPGGVDVGGNPLGQNLNRWDDQHAHHNHDHHGPRSTGSEFDLW
ncbi:MAG: hypothetical protein K2W91_04935 [Novosphingobium sp.]|nr:hypothetical protein [Novosphingobium sp.]